MMPYSGGLAGIALSRLSGLPLILNLDDSPTCTDMHPHFPTRLHYRLARALEDLYVRRADAVVYVSARNLEQVQSASPSDSVRSCISSATAPSRADFRPQPARARELRDRLRRRDVRLVVAARATRARAARGVCTAPGRGSAATRGPSSTSAPPRRRSSAGRSSTRSPRTPTGPGGCTSPSTATPTRRRW